MLRSSSSILPIALISSALFLGCPPKEAKKKSEPATKPGAAAKTSTTAEVELPPGDGPVATVNGIAIPRAPFNKEYKLMIERYQRARHEVQPALRERIKDNLVRRLVDAELIRQQAEKLGVKIDPKERDEQWEAHKKRYGTEEAFKQFLERAGTTAEDVREQFEQNLLREKLFAKVSESVDATPAEVKEFYEKNKERYDEAEQVQASHILIRVPQDATPEVKAQKKKRAEEAMKKAKAKGADFAAIAKEYGEDPTKDRGGDLGLFTKGRMVKPFEDAVWPMKVGQVSNVVETQFGYHVIKKTDHKPGRKKPFKEVEEQIQKSIQARKRNEAIRDSLAKWKEQAKIEIFVKGDEKIMAVGQPSSAPPIVNPHVPVAPAPNTGGADLKPGTTTELKVQKVPTPDTRDTPATAKPEQK